MARGGSIESERGSVKRDVEIWVNIKNLKSGRSFVKKEQSSLAACFFVF